MSTVETKPLVAVSTPVYNGEAYLERCIASVQAQTYPNLIHVIVDNASTDGTPAIIERFKNRRVPILTKRNPETIPVARNWSAAAAFVPKEAKYFQNLCADDEISPDYVTKMTAVAMSDPQITLVGCMLRVDDRFFPSSLPTDKNVFDGPSIVRSFLNKKSNDIPHMFGFFRRDDEDFENDFFRDGMWSFDGDACLRALTRGKFGFVHEPLFIGHDHKGSLTNTLLSGNRYKILEPLITIDRWGSATMSPAEYQACRRRHLRVIYRFMLAWRATGRTDHYEHAAELVRQRSAIPGFGDYALSVLEWPLHLVRKHIRQARLEAPFLMRSGSARTRHGASP